MMSSGSPGNSGSVQPSLDPGEPVIAPAFSNKAQDALRASSFVGPILMRRVTGRARFDPLNYVIKPPEPKIPPRPVRVVPQRRPASFVFPASLHLSDRISPHALAHDLIWSDKPVIDTIEEKLPEQKRELSVAHLGERNPSVMTCTGHLFRDIYEASLGIGYHTFLRMVATMALVRRAKISKSDCLVRLMEFGQFENIQCLGRMIDTLKILQDFYSLPVINKEDSPVLTRQDTLFQGFASEIPEFEDRRMPPDDREKLEFTPVEKIPLNTDHWTISYITDQSPLQSDIFSSFLFNSRYISVLAGSESGQTNDEDIAYENEVINYFMSTTCVPDLQVKLLNLKRAYALLSLSELPAFNRFPRFLVFSIHLLFDRASRRKVFNSMREHYEIAAPIMARTIKNAIDRIEEEMPKCLVFLKASNYYLTSKAYFGFEDKGLLLARQQLNSKNTITISMAGLEKWFYTFLKAFAYVVHPNSLQVQLFFDLMDNLKSELLMMRPFAAALLLIPSMVEMFKGVSAQMENHMDDELCLRARDRFITKLAEKVVMKGGNLADQFIQSSAPLAMRMFFDYSISFTLARKEMSPQTLAFSNSYGCTLMKEITTFFSLISSLQFNGDFIALCDLYYDKVQRNEIAYLQEAAQILQGRDICRITRVEDQLTIDVVQSHHSFALSSHYTYCHEPASALPIAEPPVAAASSEVKSDTSKVSDASVPRA